MAAIKTTATTFGVVTAGAITLTPTERLLGLVDRELFSLLDSSIYIQVRTIVVKQRPHLQCVSACMTVVAHEDKDDCHLLRVKAYNHLAIFVRGDPTAPLMEKAFRIPQPNHYGTSIETRAIECIAAFFAAYLHKPLLYSSKGLYEFAKELKTKIHHLSTKAARQFACQIMATDWRQDGVAEMCNGIDQCMYAFDATLRLKNGTDLLVTISHFCKNHHVLDGGADVHDMSPVTFAVPLDRPCHNVYLRNVVASYVSLYCGDAAVREPQLTAPVVQRSKGIKRARDI